MKKSDENLNEKFAKMDMNKTVIEAKICDDEENRLSSLNDFHLAETDLINCLLRTNIIQRIAYIISSMKLENSTKLSCIKLLIRLARTNQTIADKILSHHELMKSLLHQFDHKPECSKSIFNHFHQHKSMINSIFNFSFNNSSAQLNKSDSVEIASRSLFIRKSFY